MSRCLSSEATCSSHGEAKLIAYCQECGWRAPRFHFQQNDRLWCEICECGLSQGGRGWAETQSWTRISGKPYTQKKSFSKPLGHLLCCLVCTGESKIKVCELICNHKDSTELLFEFSALQKSIHHLNIPTQVEHEFGWTQEGLWLQVLGTCSQHNVYTLPHTPSLPALGRSSKSTDVPTEGAALALMPCIIMDDLEHYCW